MTETTFFSAACKHADKLLAMVHETLIAEPVGEKLPVLWHFRFDATVQCVKRSRWPIIGQRTPFIESAGIYEPDTLCWMIVEPDGLLSQGADASGTCFFLGEDAGGVSLITFVPSLHDLITKLTGLMGRDVNQLQLFK